MANDPIEEAVGAVRDYFDAFGVGEWERLVQSPSARVSLELHRRFLARFIRLELNRDNVVAAGCSQYVEDRLLLDVRDLSAFTDGAFDGVVAYGGPLSYAFDQASAALAECIRVTRPGGVVLGSVMSTIGSFRWFLPGVAEEIKTFGFEAMDALLHTGDTRPTQPSGHNCRMFR